MPSQRRACRVVVEGGGTLQRAGTFHPPLYVTDPLHLVVRLPSKFTQRRRSQTFRTWRARTRSSNVRNGALSPFMASIELRRAGSGQASKEGRKEGHRPTGDRCVEEVHVTATRVL